MTLGNQASTGFASNSSALLQACVELTQSDALPWVEVFAPQDVICSGRFDAGALPNARCGKIKLQSALFKEALSSAEYQRQRWQFFQAHLQYLRSSNTGYGFDFIACMTSSTACAAYQPCRDPSIKPLVQ